MAYTPPKMTVQLDGITTTIATDRMKFKSEVLSALLKAHNEKELWAPEWLLDGARRHARAKADMDNADMDNAADGEHAPLLKASG